MRIWLLILGLATLTIALSYEAEDLEKQIKDLEEEATRCSNDTLTPNFLPPTWDSRPNQNPINPQSKPSSQNCPASTCTPPPACDCKCGQAISCTNYVIKSFVDSLPSRGWFWAAGVLGFVVYLPRLISQWVIALTTLVKLWRDGVILRPRPVPGSAIRAEKT